MHSSQIIYYGKHTSRFGLCTIGIDANQICYLGFLKKNQDERQLYKSLFPHATLVHRAKRAKILIDKIFSKNGGQNTLPLLLNGTPFQIKVWKALLQIPMRKLVSYQDIACAIGNNKAARAVGNAIAANHIAYLIPCHRVIKQSGEIGKYRWGSDRKGAMIAWEKTTSG